MRLCLVEDLAVAGVEPLTLTRPMHELLLGCSTLGCKIASAFGVGPGPQRRGSVVRSHLVAVQRQRDPHMVANDRDWLARGPVIVANARWVPPSGFEPPDSHGPWVGLCDGQPACALVGPEDAVSLDPHGIDSWFDKIASRHSGIDMGGEWICRPWDSGGPQRSVYRARFSGGPAQRRDQPATGNPGPGGAFQPAARA